MDFGNMQVVLPLGVIIAIATLITIIQKIIKNFNKDRKERDDLILHEAKENANLVKAELETKIEVLKQELSNLEQNINKDVEHLKDLHEGEMKNLSNKIEELREQLLTQHSQLLQLLTSLVNSKE